MSGAMILLYTRLPAPSFTSLSCTYGRCLYITCRISLSIICLSEYISSHVLSLWQGLAGLNIALPGAHKVNKIYISDSSQLITPYQVVQYHEDMIHECDDEWYLAVQHLAIRFNTGTIYKGATCRTSSRHCVFTKYVPSDQHPRDVRSDCACKCLEILD